MFGIFISSQLPLFSHNRLEYINLCITDQGLPILLTRLIDLRIVIAIVLGKWKKKIPSPALITSNPLKQNIKMQLVKGSLLGTFNKNGIWKPVSRCRRWCFSVLKQGRVAKSDKTNNLYQRLSRSRVVIQPCICIVLSLFFLYIYFTSL